MNVMMKNFIFEIKTELTKIQIPGKKEVISSAISVILAVMTLGILFFFLDSTFKFFLGKLIGY